METLDGMVTEVRFQNEESGFAILKFHVEKRGDFSCLGILAPLRVGEMVTFHGHFEQDKKWGEQFRVHSFEYRTAAGLHEIEYMLGSGLIDGIGKKRASDIVAKFGLDTIRVLDQEPGRLKEVPGIGKTRGKQIIESWKSQQGMRELMLFLQPYGISLNFVYKIHKRYDSEAKSKISENPYRLIDDMRGVGFKKADMIAQSIGYDRESYLRLKAAIVHSLHEAEGNGHCYLDRKELLAKAIELTGVDDAKMGYSLDHLITDTILIAQEDAVYLRKTFERECELAKMLVDRIAGSKILLMEEKKARAWAEDRCRRRDIQVNEQQIGAVLLSQKERVMVLTGGPGTGKTTTLKLVIDLFYDNGKKVVLAAPTGRAAQKMGEVTGREGKTIHRLLEYTMGAKGPEFQRREENPLEGDIFVIDEFSMVDLQLAHSLLKAIPKNGHIIFVGDADQLPSVGAGNVLADLIDCGLIPLVRLTTIFRQAGESRIVTAAHEICHGDVPEFANKKSDTCFFITENDPEKLFDLVIDLVARRLPEAYEFDPAKEIQVITAMHKGSVGTQRINEALQKRLNGESKEKISRGDHHFAVGDKVMQISNNYDLQAFNGDIGFVVRVNETSMTVSFPAITATYEKKDFDQLVHAYCISIHKSQGSEFPALVIPLSTQQFVMLRRNLIYTALTRAKKLCVFVGSKEALAMAVKNRSDKKRNSGLADRIRSLVTVS